MTEECREEDKDCISDEGFTVISWVGKSVRGSVVDAGRATCPTRRKCCDIRPPRTSSEDYTLRLRNPRAARHLVYELGACRLLADIITIDGCPSFAPFAKGGSPGPLSRDPTSFVDSRTRRPYSWRVEISFTPEQEAQLSRIASYNGTPAEQLVKEAALRLVEEEARFRAGVKRGIEQADRGELLDHDEVKARIQRLLQSE